ncbi:hypothetical protein GCM10027051_10860 [Niabella terrae]
MKYLFLGFIISLPMMMAAQTQPDHPSLISTKPAIVSDILDTSHMYASRYGQVARLTLDNMPCILPYKNQTRIPNAVEGKSVPRDIPNAWNIPEKSLHSGDLDCDYKKPFQRLQWKNGLPFIYGRDSLARLILPIDGASQGVAR